MRSKKRLIYTNPASNRLAASEAATLRMIATLLNYREELAVEDGLVFKAD